jgi:hypothetical protein
MDNKIQELFDLATSMAATYNDEVDVQNAMHDELDEVKASLATAVSELEVAGKMLDKQAAVIAAAVVQKQRADAELNVLRAQIKEHQKIDAKRLVKVNTEQKKTITGLKERLETVEAARKKVVKQNKDLTADALSSGNAAFHFDPESKNAIRIIPNLYIAENNEYDGVKGSPVVEFIHHARGITRQGVLQNNGTINWASASNSTPTPQESLVAKSYIEDWCKAHRVKVAA